MYVIAAITDGLTVVQTKTAARWAGHEVMRRRGNPKPVQLVEALLKHILKVEGAYGVAMLFLAEAGDYVYLECEGELYSFTVDQFGNVVPKEKLS